MTSGGCLVHVWEKGFVTFPTLVSSKWNLFYFTLRSSYTNVKYFQDRQRGDTFIRLKNSNKNDNSTNSNYQYFFSGKNYITNLSKQSITKNEKSPKVGGCWKKERKRERERERERGTERGRYRFITKWGSFDNTMKKTKWLTLKREGTNGLQHFEKIAYLEENIRFTSN